MSEAEGDAEVEIEVEMDAETAEESDPLVMESISTQETAPVKDEPVVLPDLEEGLESKAKEAVVREKPPLEEFVEPEVTVITSDKDKDKDKDKPKADKSLNVFKLFRYATGLDFLLMTVGAVSAIIHGSSLPLLMFVFGELTNTFINQAISRNITTSFNNGSYNCSASLNPLFFINDTITDFLGDTCRNISQLTPSSTYSDLLINCGQQSPCVGNDEFIATINNQVFAFIGIALGVFIFANLQISFLQLACERQVQKIRHLYYQAILRQEIGWFDAHSSGELATRLTDDVGKIHAGIGDKVALLLQWLATFVGGFVIGFVRDWRLTLVLLGFTPFLAIGGFIMTKVIGQFANEEQKEYASAGGVAEEVLGAIRTVVSFGGEFKEGDRYDDKLKQARRLGLKKGLSVGVSFGSVFFLFFVVESAAFWFGGYLISVQLTQGGDVVGVFFAVLIGAFALGQAGPYMEKLVTAAGAATTIFNTIDRESEINPSSDNGLIPDSFDSTIELKDVAFSYPIRPEIEVMSGFSMKVDVGKTFALVGASGCGKSTVVQLIQRFYDVSHGQVLVGGVDVRELNIKWLRNNIGVVSQEPVLFDTTIADNIRYGRDDATIEDIKNAAKNANVHEFINSLPNGYDTLAGERGTQLSGGQKQRIAIARALVRDPKILLLDEATSALDTESESIVQKALDKAREGRTTIVIAHRLSTIQSADVIISVEAGRVVEMGTHSELMDKEGLYYDLVTAQSYTSDEQFALGEEGEEVISPARSSARQSSRRRKRSGSVGSVGEKPALGRQESATQKQISVEEGKLKRLTSKVQQEEWDKEIPEVSLRRVLALNAKEWWIIIIGLLGACVNGSIWPLFGILFGEVLSVFQAPPNMVLERTHLWGGLFLVLGVVSGIGIFFKTVCFSVSGENLTSRLRSRSFKAMLRQDITWFDDERNSSGALVTRLANDASQVQGATGERLGTLVESFFGMLLALLISFIYNWVLSLVILGVVPIVMIAGSLEVRAITGQAGQNKRDLESAGKVAVDSLENIRTVASLGIEGNFSKQYEYHLSGPYKKAKLNAFVYGLTYAISQCVIFLMYAVVFRFGAFQVTLPTDNVAYFTFDNVFVAFSALIFGAAGAGQAAAFAPNYAKAKLSANRIFFLLDRVPEIDGYSEEGEKPQQNITGSVSVNSVHFNYPSRPDVKVLQGLELEVKPGHTLALVGPSGCGKSTVVSLLERFYDPQSGSLSLDGKDIRDLNIRWLRSQIGFVSQEPILMDSSIADNIRYGANFREVSGEEVIEAAKAANIHTFVETLPQGYNTNVGAKGTQLSGGQKQRIAIARALVRDPKILLLDEATSALDTESEKIVQDALDRAREGRTSIVIAHRLSTIYNADCIIVISGGRAVEAGTHSELMDKKGIYYRLNRYQMVEKKLEK